MKLIKFLANFNPTSTRWAQRHPAPLLPEKGDGRKARADMRILFILLILIPSIACSLQAKNSGEPLFTTSTGEPTPVNFVQPSPTVSETQPTEDFLVAAPVPTATLAPTSEMPLIYHTLAGDTLAAVAVRFGVQPSEISTPPGVTLPSGLLPPDQYLIIPRRLYNTTSPQRLLPDSEIVYSPSAVDFDVEAFVRQAGGYLSTYSEYLNATGNTSGAAVIRRVATENSINPRLLLALLEYQSHWVYGKPGNLAEEQYPMGNIALNQQGLYQQLVWAISQISLGYYGWREGLLTDITFPDGVTARLAPDLNAGTVALQYYFAKLYNTERWLATLDLSTTGFSALYERMFDNPWIRAQAVEPLYPPGLEQPTLALPFKVGQLWSFTGGPHGAWDTDGALAALDFAPAADQTGCVATQTWAVASAAGRVVRSGNGVVALDLDGDGKEQTGWVMMYLHVSSYGRAPLGDWLEKDSLLGHPSCEGGVATGTHIHIARKYNGEWIPADGPIPFVLSGWTAHAGNKPYIGTLTRDGKTVFASMYGSYESRIIRDPDDP